MDQINYQPESFSGIIPELKVPDYSSSFLESQRSQLSSMEDQLQDIRQKGKVDKLNLENRQENEQALMKLSKTLADKGLEEYQEYKKSEYDKTFFKYYNMSPEEQEALIKQQQKQESDLQAEYNADGKSVASAVQSDPENAGTYNSLMSLSGYRRVAAMNALALARVNQYPELLAGIKKKLNPQTPPDFAAVTAEATSQFGRQTGFNQANAGFLAKNVFPKLRRINDQETEMFRRQYGATEGEKLRIVQKQDFENGGKFEDLRVGMTSTLDTDGKTLFSNSKVLAWMDRATKTGEVSKQRVLAMGDEVNTVTGKKWSEDSRWAVWVDNARKAELEKRNLDDAVTRRNLRDRLEPADTEEAIREVENQALREGVSPSIIQDEVTRRRKATAGARETQNQIDAGNKYLNDNPDEDKVSWDIWKDWNAKAKAAFKGRLEEDPNGESVIEDLAASKEGKLLEKDMSNVIGAVDPNVKLENKLLGVRGPANQKQFEFEARQWILGRAAQLLPAVNNYGEAIEQAKQQWIQGQKDNIAKNGLGAFYKNGFLVGGKGAAMTVGQAQASGMMARAYESSTLNNFQDVLEESDFQIRSDGNYSPVVRMFARKFDMRPEALVSRARVNRGLKPVETNSAKAVAQIPAEDQARLSAVTNPSVQSLMRAQIKSGQVIEGTPEQKAVAVGRHIIAMGYGGVWQNQFFNYDRGYVPEGGQRVMQRPYKSAHNEGMGRALDIGLAANGREKLDRLAVYLKLNQQRFGITQIIWDSPGHYDHIHIEF